MAPTDSFVSSLPETPIPTESLRDLEDHDRVVHVVPLLSTETGSGEVTERFLIQLRENGYVLEHVPDLGWEVIERVDAGGRDEEEVLAELVGVAREWHAEIVEIVEGVTGTRFDEKDVESMNHTLERELRRKGYDHLLAGEEESA